MRLEYSFTRTGGGGGTLGTDVTPTNSAYLDLSNVFFAPQYGVHSEPIASIAFAYDAPIGGPSVDVIFYLWDEESEEWYEFGTDTIIRGEVHYIPLPNIIDRKVSRQDSRIAVAVVATPTAAAPAGDYEFSVASSTGASFSNVVAVLAAIQALLTSIDGKIENPMPIEGATAVGVDPTVAGVDPLDLGAVVQDADPGPYVVDGLIRRLRLDNQGRLIVTGVGSSVQGIDADDDPVTANPVVVGGVYYSDPTADTIDDGDVGYALLNDLRMQVVEDRAYDPTSDANKTIPVWSPPDLWSPEDLSGSSSAVSSTSYYIALEENSRWSLQYIPSPGGANVLTLTVHQSNEDDPDITARTYTDVTTTFFGTSGFTAESWIEIERPTRAKSLRVDVDSSTADASTWDLWLMKGSNS